MCETVSQRHQNLRTNDNRTLFEELCFTYGKNLNALTSKLFFVNASRMSSSVTVVLERKITLLSSYELCVCD